MSKYDDAMRQLTGRFGKDTVISLATVGQFPNAEGKSRPAVRNINSFYEDGAFYTVTYALSNKMRQIAENPEVAINVCFEWFTASGTGENLGWVRDEKNAEMMAKLRAAFAEWYGNGHTNENDPNTCLLRIKLTNGVIIDHQKKYGEGRYEIDFVNKTAK